MDYSGAKAAIQSFSNIFPDVKVDCVDRCNWISDCFAFMHEYYVLTFYERKLINDDATIVYEQKGKYTKKTHHSDVDLVDVDQYALSPAGTMNTYYVSNWDVQNLCYVLKKSNPNGTAWQGKGDVWDVTLKEGAALCRWSRYVSFEGSQYLEKETDRLLELKYQSIESRAASKKYKPGWVYHRMREPIPAVTHLWRQAGYYFPLDDKASGFSSRYKWKYFKTQAQEELNEMLEAYPY